MARTANEFLLVHPPFDAARPHAQVVLGALEVVGHLLQVLDHPEMGKREPLRLVVEDVVERSLPPLEVDVRWRSVRNDVPRSFQPHAAGVAGIERPVPSIQQTWCEAWPGVGKETSPSSRWPATWTFSAGTGTGSPNRVSSVSP